MNSYLIIFAIFLITVLIVLIGFLCFVGLKFVKQNEKSIASKNKNTKNEKEESLDSVNSAFCVDHEEAFSAGNCSIDGQSYCELCLTRIDDMKFARKNSDEYLNYKWSELTMFKNDVGQTDFNERLKKVKVELWNIKKPLIIRGHFKINVENDSIESFTTLMCREEDKKLMQKELEFIKL